MSRVRAISSSRPCDVETAARRHARDDARAADRHVGVLVREQDRRADALVAAARGVRAVDAGEDRNASLLELGVAEERRAVAAPVGVELLLLRQLHAAAVDEPDQRQVQPLGEVGDAQDVLRLARDPGAREHLVVEADDHRPAAADLRQPVDDVGRALDVARRVVQAVQRMPGAGVDEVFEPLPHRQRAALVDLGSGQADVLALLPGRRDLGLDGFELGAARLRPGDTVVLERLAERRHLLEVRSHRDSPCATGVAVRCAQRFGVCPQAMPEMMIFWMFEVPSTTCSDLASR